MKSIILILISVFVLSGCYYKPFVSYRLNKKGFKHFTNKEKFIGDNSNPLRNYDVKVYDWTVEVFPEKKQIKGEMIIKLRTTNEQANFMFDMQSRLKLKSFSCSHEGAKLKHKKDLLFLSFEQPVAKDKVIELSINYEGKPANLVGEGPIRWKEDKEGRPWISTSTEGIGPHFIMPCNALLRDEADSTFITVTVPEGLVVAANGRRLKTSTQNNKSTFNYLVTNPINVYNISFNVGHFVTFDKPYTDINGEEQKIECMVLDYNEVKAKKFYNQVPKVMEVFENLLGEFPWWNDGCRFIESNFGAMEHQSGIALGPDYRYDWRDYNTTLVHELAHEWWGNSVTAYDYCDAWIHEGLATYMEALFLEKVYGKEAYNRKINFFVNSTNNQIPIRKKCDVLYSSWISYNDMDIYDKGALLMHSLRVEVDNDTLFFEALKKFQLNMKLKNITAEKFIDEFNRLLSHNYDALFDVYLNQTLPPTLVYYVHELNGHNQLHYKWLEPLPFKLKNGLYLELDGQELTINPTDKYQILNFKKGEYFKFLLDKCIYFTFMNVKV